MKAPLAFFTVALNTLLLFGQNIDLTGTVKNQAGEPVKNLALILVNAGLTETTDSGGRFEFNKMISAIENPALHQESSVRLDGSWLLFSVAERAKKVTIELYTIQGAKVATILDRQLATGDHRIPISAPATNRVSSSIVLMVLRRGNQITRFQLMNIGNRYHIAAMKSIVSSNHSESQAKKAATSGIIDTLIIERKDTVEMRMAISTYEDNLTILLDLIPWEVLELAISEKGNGPDQVGKNVDDYPFAISNYLAPNEAWCSEFVSWVYRAAGYPLSGGSEGGWMVRSSVDLRGWFQKNTRFVSHTDPDWTNFEPSPGDYIRYDYQTLGGHSGIVRYAEGSTLYTVEGNVNNMVMLRTIKNYKDFSQTEVDGIGMRSGFAGK